MDWFFVTHIWAEPCGGKLVHRFRLQKISLETKSWWIAKGSPEPGPPDSRKYSKQIEDIVCPRCNQSSPRVYKIGWFCTSTDCDRFSKILGRNLPSRLEFTEEFINQRTKYTDGVSDPCLESFTRTSVPVPQDAQQFYSRDAWRGRVCPFCKGCIARVQWEGYYCRTPGCSFISEPPLQIMPPKACYEGLFNAYEGHAWPDVRTKFPDVVVEHPGETDHEWNIFKFELSEGCTFAHLSSNLRENQRRGGSEDLFVALQQTKIGLSRRVMSGNGLTRHFAVNHGMHYKYHAHHGTTPFNESPTVIHAALSQLQWAARRIAGNGLNPINELLTVAYFEDMKMNYHDDGESTVGNTVVSLSLGHPAVMSFKMKEKIYSLHGLTAANYDPTAPVVRGSKCWVEREKLNAEWKSLPLRARTIRTNKIFKALEADRKSSPVLFEATLKFGDMMVMHGDDFQKIYDHCVVPQGNMRFALTGRHMKLSEFKEEEHWKGQVEIDPKQAYSPDPSHERVL